jgi:hypothetical protein
MSTPIDDFLAGMAIAERNEWLDDYAAEAEHRRDEGLPPIHRCPCEAAGYTCTGLCVDWPD